VEAQSNWQIKGLTPKKMWHPKMQIRSNKYRMQGDRQWSRLMRIVMWQDLFGTYTTRLIIQNQGIRQKGKNLLQIPGLTPHLAHVSLAVRLHYALTPKTYTYRYTAGSQKLRLMATRFAD
jgi:hypothetical protein